MPNPTYTELMDKVGELETENEQLSAANEELTFALNTVHELSAPDEDADEDYVRNGFITDGVKYVADRVAKRRANKKADRETGKEAIARARARVARKAASQ